MTITKTYTSKWTIFLVVAFSAFVFCFMGFYNNFPLLYNDTGTYINSGFSCKVPKDRPIIYGLFIRHACLNESLWLVIYLQSLILSYVLYKLFSRFLEGKQLLSTMMAFVFTTTLITGASVCISQLMPDVFTPVCIIVLALLLTSKLEMSRIEFWMLFLIGVFAIGVHNSHGVTCLLIVTAWVIWQSINSKQSLAFKQIFRPVGITLSMIIAGMFLNNITSLALGQGFFPPNGSHVFMMGRLSEEGLLDAYLHEKCEEKNYRICVYKDSIPANFIWDYKNSPLYKTGGWQANEQEYRTIITDILTTPKYFKKFAIRSFENWWAQLFSFNTGDTPFLGPNDRAYQALQAHYPDYLRQYENSFQYRNQLNYNFINQVQRLFVMLCVLFIILYFIKSSQVIATDFNACVFILFSGIILNALICPTFSTVSSRYESRVIWLIAIPVFIIVGKSKWAEKFFANNNN